MGNRNIDAYVYCGILLHRRLCTYKGFSFFFYNSQHLASALNTIIENVSVCFFLGYSVDSQNCFYKDFQCRLNLDSACYHVVENLFFPLTMDAGIQGTLLCGVITGI